MNDIRYEVITQKDEEGNLIIPLPLPLLKSLGWKEGDNVTISISENGEFYLKKI
jgi:antitoxin component of MazEF toxin-antitoxin module